MKHERLETMFKGWFVGAFEPTVAHSDACEVAIKHYRAGDSEALHHHRIAVEITAIVSGTVRMMGRTWGPGDIIVIQPGEATDFYAVSDAINVVVKLPCARGDKYPGVIDET